MQIKKTLPHKVTLKIFFRILSLVGKSIYLLSRHVTLDTPQNVSV